MLAVVVAAVIVTLPPPPSPGGRDTYTAAPVVLTYRIIAQPDTPLYTVLQLLPSMIPATHRQHLIQYYNWQHLSATHHPGCNLPDRILRTADILISAYLWSVSYLATAKKPMNLVTVTHYGKLSIMSPSTSAVAAYPWTSCDENKSKLPGIISAPWTLQEQSGGFAEQDELKTSK